MGKIRRTFETMGLAAGLIAGEGAMSAQNPKPERSAPTQRGPERRASSFNPTVELNKFLAEHPTTKTGEVNLEVLKQDAERNRKEVEDKLGGTEHPDDLGKILLERASNYEIVYNVLTLLKQEIPLWEQHIKNAADNSVKSQLFHVGTQLDLVFIDIKAKLKVIEWEQRLLSKGEPYVPRGANREIYVNLRGFNERVVTFIRAERKYYSEHGANIKLNDPGEDIDLLHR